MISAAKSIASVSRTCLLRPGQRLSQPEFHRRYGQTPPGLRCATLGVQLLDGDPTELVRTAPRGLASAEHGRFAARLRSARRR